MSTRSSPGRGIADPADSSRKPCRAHHRARGAGAHPFHRPSSFIVAGTSSARTTLEPMGHCDPRVIASGQLFRATLLDWLPPLGLADDRARLTAILDEELAR